nr:MAG TPA: hypothetical protein [Caudoviricetes sp.]
MRFDIYLVLHRYKTSLMFVVFDIYLIYVINSIK